MTRAMKLSVLDLTPILEGETASDAFAHSEALVQAAEDLGLARFWLAEHHNAAALACSCPEVLIARLASLTRRISIGAGGIMLPNHASLKVAETFRVLGALFGRRIDLGLGRAPGTDPRTAAALRRGAADAFPEQLESLLAYFSPDDVPRSPFPTSTLAIPANVPAPQLFVLSSSGFGAKVAAERGLGLAFAHHMNPRDAVEALRTYRRAFMPSSARAEPYAIVSTAVVCAPTTAEAKHLATSGELAMLRLAQGKRDAPLASASTAAAYPWEGDEKTLQRLHRRVPFVGDVDRVASKLRTLRDDSEADEIMMMTMVYDQALRQRSYALLADALG
jgi:luciferase family oxidoreductase group 1